MYVPGLTGPVFIAIDAPAKSGLPVSPLENQESFIITPGFVRQFGTPVTNPLESYRTLLPAEYSHQNAHTQRHKQAGPVLPKHDWHDTVHQHGHHFFSHIHAGIIAQTNPQCNQKIRQKDAGMIQDAWKPDVLSDLILNFEPRVQSRLRRIRLAGKSKTATADQI